MFMQGSVSTTLAGGGASGCQDGIGTDALFNFNTYYTTQIVLDALGDNLYVADAYNNAIRKFTIATGPFIINTV